MSRRRDRNSRHSRQRDRDKLLWSTRRFRVGTLTGPAYVEFNFPTEGGGLSRLCVPNSDLRHMNALLDQFSDLLPIFPGDVPSTDGGHKQFIQALVVANDVPLELVPTRPGFIDQNTFANSWRNYLRRRHPCRTTPACDQWPRRSRDTSGC